VTALFGLLNGLLVTRVKLPPFIVTLGTLNIAFAITQLYSNSQTVTDLPPRMTWLGNTFPLGGTEVGYGAVLMIAAVPGVWFWLRETAAGRHVYAVGNNPEATRLVGIPTERVLLGVYVLAGVFYGIASLLSVARTGVGDPNAGQTENLDAITAVVLGGTSLFGGRGVILGTLVGAVVVGVLRNGLTLMGVSSVYQVLITGILVILAVAVDQLSRKGGTLMASAPIVMQAKGLVKRYGQVTALDGADFRVARRRDPGRDRRQRRRQVLADQVPVGRHHPRRRRDPARRQAHPLQEPDRRAPRRHRDGLPGPGRGPGDDHRREPVPGPRDCAARGFLGNVLRMLDKKKMLEESIARMNDLKVGIRSMTQAVETLSGGQRQCVAVARAAAFASTW
jgi:branched-subunit amino acid ABC-type transport system permease component